MKVRDWYFQGWERREDAKGRAAFVYTGEYYSFPAKLKRPKLTAALYTAAVAACYCLAAFSRADGAMWRIAAVPQLLDLIPLIYLVLGAVCLIAAKQPMTFRAWYTSWRRLRSAALWCAVLAAGMAAVQLVYIVMNGAYTPLEFGYLAASLASGLSAYLLRRRMTANPCDQTGGSSD